MESVELTSTCSCSSPDLRLDPLRYFSSVVADEVIYEVRRHSIECRVTHLDGFPIRLEVSLTKLKVYLQELWLKDSLVQSQSRGVREITGLVFNDIVQSNSFKNLLELDVRDYLDASFGDSITR